MTLSEFWKKESFLKAGTRIISHYFFQGGTFLDCCCDFITSPMALILFMSGGSTDSGTSLSPYRRCPTLWMFSGAACSTRLSGVTCVVMSRKSSPLERLVLTPTVVSLYKGLPMAV